MRKEVIEAHLQELVNDGWNLQDERFTYIVPYNYLAQLLFEAKLSLDLLKNIENSFKGNEFEIINIKQSLIRNVIMNYAKCFSSSGKGRRSLNKRKVFEDMPRLMSIHEKIMDSRNRFFAHNDNSEHDRASIATKNYEDCIRIQHLYTVAINAQKLDDYYSVVNFCERYIIYEINKAINSLEQSLGKPIQWN